ncbi:MAG: extracellular solute-binding protein [Candidatus Omnitrophota bacterium]|nr:extracellular solute-binding protein [Candidatus Omnitrophota bacterium]MBU2528965.1 extracellular solute-binding protein [bacterium]MBU3930175.1 extracellular solute-binding protein [bacterium]MBU4122540.1 extracellular solute-binding protein [bacterium]
MSKLKLLLAIVLFAGGALGIVCRKRNKGGRMLNVYTSVPLEIAETLVRRFEKDHPKIKIAMRRAGSREIVEEVSKEFESGVPRADVVWLADFVSAEELKEKGFLRKYVSPQSARIPAIFKDSGGYYTGSRLLNMVVVYNSELVKKRPIGYKDLLDEDFKGKIAIADPSRAGTVRYAVGALLLDKDFGWPYFVKLYRNKCRIVHDNTGMTKMIAEGELHMGISIDFTVRKLLKDNPSLPIDYIYPADGVLSVPSPIAVISGSPNAAAAEKFIDWALSAKTQGFMCKEMGIVSLRKDIAVPAGMPSLADLEIIPSNPQLILKTASRCDRIFNDIFSGKPLDEINTGLFPPENGTKGEGGLR